jgi:hypothetical protein
VKTGRRPRRVDALIGGGLALVADVAASCASSGRSLGPPSSSSSSAARSAPLFVHYYLWWDAALWQSKLGPAFPMRAHPTPLPATIHSDGCDATSNYRGNTLLDVPSTPPGFVNQDDPSVLARDCR